MPAAVAVGEFLRDGHRSFGSRRLLARLAFFAPGPDLGVSEISQSDGRQNAERNPLDAVGQKRPSVQMWHADHAESTGLVLDQLQIGPGERNFGQRRNLFGVHGIHLLKTVSGERVLVRHGGLGVAQARSEGDRFPRRTGDRWDVGAWLGPYVTTVDENGWPVVDGKRRQHLKSLI